MHNWNHASSTRTLIHNYTNYLTSGDWCVFENLLYIWVHIKAIPWKSRNINPKDSQEFSIHVKFIFFWKGGYILTYSIVSVCFECIVSVYFLAYSRILGVYICLSFNLFECENFGMLFLSEDEDIGRYSYLHYCTFSTQKNGYNTEIEIHTILFNWLTEYKLSPWSIIKSSATAWLSLSFMNTNTIQADTCSRSTTKMVVALELLLLTLKKVLPIGRSKGRNKGKNFYKVNN